MNAHKFSQELQGRENGQLTRARLQDICQLRKDRCRLKVRRGGMGLDRRELMKGILRHEWKCAR